MIGFRLHRSGSWRKSGHFFYSLWFHHRRIEAGRRLAGQLTVDAFFRSFLPPHRLRQQLELSNHLSFLGARPCHGLKRLFVRIDQRTALDLASLVGLLVRQYDPDSAVVTIGVADLDLHSLFLV